MDCGFVEPSVAAVRREARDLFLFRYFGLLSVNRPLDVEECEDGSGGWRVADQRGARTTDLEDSAALNRSGGVLIPSLSLFLSLNPKTLILNDDDGMNERGRGLEEERNVYSEGWLGEMGERGRRRGVREDDGNGDGDGDGKGYDDEDDVEGGWEMARVAIL